MALLTVAAGGLGWTWHRYQASGPLNQPINVVIPRGAGVEDVASLLAERGVIANPIVFRIGATLDGQARNLKAGEFAFAASISGREAAALIASGRTVVRRLTLVEGQTTAHFLAQVRTAEGLMGEVGTAPAEGELLPDTYFYSWGETRERMLGRQRRAMAETLAELWTKRTPGLPLQTPQQAVILASIVEKETSVAEERALVAAVFLNRLRRGMRLQADPTVIYGLTQGAASLDRPLSRADLATPHAWNTYVIDGLPPTPIANPGRAALAAVLNPAASDALYFVADGTGRHVFARTLAEHNANVTRLRQIERQRSQSD